jgi:glutathione peroxidase
MDSGAHGRQHIVSSLGSPAMSAHQFSFPGRDGGEVKLADYAGKAVLVVNVASECGYTPQYAGLQSLWRGRKADGLVVLGVPSNDFGAQEPGSEAEIKAFCEASYGADFPMTSKQAVIGGKAHPFYRWIVDEAGEAAAPRWNFHKYLIGPDGGLAGVWPSSVEPESAEIADAVDEALKERKR